MSPDRWQQLIDHLDDQGRLESRETENLGERPGTVERVVVKTSVGRFRLSFTTEPKRLGEKALYSKRGGSTVNVQTRYDETEQVHIFTVEQYSAERPGWSRIDPASFSV